MPPSAMTAAFFGVHFLFRGTRETAPAPDSAEFPAIAL
jgi:hypothetical protein